MSAGAVDAKLRSGTPRVPIDIVRIGVPIALLVGAMLLLPIGDVRGDRTGFIAFSEMGPVPAMLDLVAGQALLFAGVLAWMLGPRARVGTLAILAGVAWFGADLFAQDGASSLVRATGRFLLGPLLLPLLLHLAIAALHLDGGRRARVGLAVLYTWALAVAVWNSATYDGFHDLYCVACEWHSPLLIDSGFLLIRAGRVAGAALAIAVAAWAGRLAIDGPPYDPDPFGSALGRSAWGASPWPWLLGSAAYRCSSCPRRTRPLPGGRWPGCSSSWLRRRSPSVSAAWRSRRDDG